MDVRLTSEQRQLRDAAADLAADLGPGTVHDLADEARVERLDKAVARTGWRALRSDGASGVEVAIVAEEFGRGLVDVAFLGPVLVDDIRPTSADDALCTVAVDGRAVDARGSTHALVLREETIWSSAIGPVATDADPTRPEAELTGAPTLLAELSPAQAAQWRSLALVATCADLVGAARGAHALATEYAKVRVQYGKPIGSHQAVAHLLAEGLALIEGSVSVLRHAAWAVDELSPDEAVRAAVIAKLYCARAARTVCETAVQVHGGIGNTWECLAHLYLRRALASTELFATSLEEIDSGLS
ncbi:acyl-CoA dehydrogenase family protein [Nocardia rosealba]|uniref:acyl-CoA dehydrogenase family protein n=1 Tax=Nocardia rosealba TaxID=2878563 RepID=UPI001CD9EE6B|nr:acyl-CoA dehydrogenase family protein [Nocardia rosealba]MCA2207816.1 acyl-CoA dehydrogenase [Nocardia rosealba]